MLILLVVSTCFGGWLMYCMSSNNNHPKETTMKVTTTTTVDPINSTTPARDIVALVDLMVEDVNPKASARLQALYQQRIEEIETALCAVTLVMASADRSAK